MRRLYQYLSLALIAVVMHGCARQDMRDLNAYIDDIKARPPGPVAPLPTMRQVTPFAYSSVDLKDPFAEVRALDEPDPVPVASGPQPDPNRPKQELEQYELDTLRMVGTLELQGDRWGLITTKEGVIHRVQAGDYAGRNNGRIVRITEEQVELVELVQVAPGRYNEREAELAVNN